MVTKGARDIPSGAAETAIMKSGGPFVQLPVGATVSESCRLSAHMIFVFLPWITGLSLLHPAVGRLVTNSEWPPRPARTAIGAALILLHIAGIAVVGVAVQRRILLEERPRLRNILRSTGSQLRFALMVTGSALIHFIVTIALTMLVRFGMAKANGIGFDDVPMLTVGYTAILLWLFLLLAFMQFLSIALPMIATGEARFPVRCALDVAQGNRLRLLAIWSTIVPPLCVLWFLAVGFASSMPVTPRLLTIESASYAVYVCLMAVSAAAYRHLKWRTYSDMIQVFD
jgi:hypothetical protein